MHYSGSIDLIADPSFSNRCVLQLEGYQRVLALNRANQSISILLYYRSTPCRDAEAAEAARRRKPRFAAFSSGRPSVLQERNERGPCLVNNSADSKHINRGRPVADNPAYQPGILSFQEMLQRLATERATEAISISIPSGNPLLATTDGVAMKTH